MEKKLLKVVRKPHGSMKHSSNCSGSSGCSGCAGSCSCGTSGANPGSCGR